MKKLALFILTLTVILPLRAQRQQMPASLAGDPDIQAFVAVTNRRFPRADATVARPRDQVLAGDAAKRESHERVRDWLARHPEHPGRRWLVLSLVDYTSAPQYIREVKEGYDDRFKATNHLLVCDESARATMATARAAWLEMVRRDAGATADERSRAAYQLAKDGIQGSKGRAEIDRWRDELEKMVAAHELNDAHAGATYYAIIWHYSTYGPAALDDYLAKLSAHPSPIARQEAAKEQERLLKQRTGLDWIKFTAVDGRAVDLSKLRGKVVLVDFGATWCVPCIAEIPNMVEAYRKYHDKGLEIVGLSLENVGVSENDSPENAASKVAAAKTKLEALIAKHDVKWPVYFETRGMKGEFSTRLGINGIPAMFLLDQEGRVVSTAAHGEALDREVKRLLKH